MQNLSALMFDQTTTCATNSTSDLVACPRYTFRFVLANHSAHAVAEIDYLRLGIGSEELFNETVGICTLAPWTPAAGASSEVINVNYQYFGGTTGMDLPRFFYDCDGAWGNAYSPGNHDYGTTMPSLPTAGFITLSVEGILADGAPFVATGKASLTPQ